MTGCEATAPLDCATVEEELYACASKYRDEGERTIFLECIPHSEAERISGTWVLSFEFTPFYEDQSLSFEEAARFHETMTQLIGPEDDLLSTYEYESTKLYDLEFIGRRPLCNLLGPNFETITVDKVISKQLVDERPSGW